MDFESYVEGILLWMVASVFIVGMATRLAFAGYARLKRLQFKRSLWLDTFIAHVRLLLPMHRLLLTQPIYTVLLYAFHLCLIVIPIWLSGHIVLWEESRFDLYWTPLPDEWIDRMTLFVIGMALFFLLWRLLSKKRRLDSSSTDYLLIGITVLPFVTGYGLTHGSLDAIDFFRDNMRMLHVLSAEGMLLGIVLLFCRIRLKSEKCIGCNACELSCPAAALESKDKETRRYLNYAHHRCVYCGTCVTTCPEDAPELEHAIGWQFYLQPLRKQVIGSVALETCAICKIPFGPVPQLEQISRTVNPDNLGLCPRCKTVRVAGVLFQMRV